MTHWRFITDSASEAKARKVLGWVLEKLGTKALDVKIEPYHKGGFQIAFNTRLLSTEWSEIVLEVLASAQRFGGGWCLTGDITQELDATCNSSNVAGVTFAHVVCEQDSPVRVVRQDDNGGQFTVGEYACRADAMAAIRKLEQAVHKQGYFIEPVVVKRCDV